MRGKGGCGSVSDFVSHLIAFDSIAPQTMAFGPCGRAEREPFGHTRRLEPQPWGAVTRRAVAQRRSRVSGLTSPSRRRLSGGFDSGFGLGFVVGPLARSAAVCRKSFVFSSLPIRNVLILGFREGALAPSLGCFLFCFQ